MHRRIPYANRSRFARDPPVANVNVVIARGKIAPRIISQGNVAVAGGVVGKGKRPGSGVADPGGVVQQRACAQSGVVAPTAVEQERRRAHSRVVIGRGQSQRPCAKSGVEAVGRVRKERIPAKRSIAHSAADIKQRVIAIGGVEPWQRARRRTLHLQQKRKEKQRTQRGDDVSSFHD